MPRIFAPPTISTNGRGGSFEQPTELPQFAVEQEPAEGFPDEAADGGGRGMGAVGGAEGVVDVDLAEGGQLGGEGRIVRFLAVVEAKVLAEQDAAVVECVGGVPDRRAHAVRGEGDGSAEDGGQGTGDRAQAEPRLDPAPRSAAVGQQDDAGAGVAESVERRLRFEQAGRVEHAVSGHRHVEVDADDDPPPAQGRGAVTEVRWEGQDSAVPLAGVALQSSGHATRRAWLLVGGVARCVPRRTFAERAPGRARCDADFYHGLPAPVGRRRCGAEDNVAAMCGATETATPFDGFVLGIETSCDDTACAVLDAEGRVLSSVVSSQLDVHRPFGGVVPEAASREHLRNWPAVSAAALQEAGVDWSDVGAVAATRGPGLVGSLLVGLSLGKAISYSLGVPFLAVHHLEGHLFSPLLETDGASRPVPESMVGLVVSGGHTSLLAVDGASGAVTSLAETRDDAIGEAFDKIGHRVGLPFPGGAEVDRLAELGDPTVHRFRVASIQVERAGVLVLGIEEPGAARPWGDGGLRR